MATPNEPRPCIGIIYALELEISPFKKILRNKKFIKKEGLHILSGNLGKINFLLARCGIGTISSYQVSKKLLQNFKLDRIISAGFAGALDESLKIGDVILSPVATSDHVIRTSKERRKLKEKTQALAVDMESSGVKKAADEFGVPFMSVKVISDAGDDLLLRRVMLNPLRLFRGYLKARNALARTLQAIEDGNSYSDKRPNENLDRGMANKLP